MSVELLTPFTQVNRRTAIKGPGDTLSGRWIQLDGAGKATAAVDPTKGGAYLVIEGNKLHVGGPADFAAGASTKATELPSVAAVGAMAIAYGIFRFHVGPEGVDQADTGFAGGAAVYLDTLGRLTTDAAAGANVKVGIVEAVSGVATAWTDITIRTVGA